MVASLAISIHLASNVARQGPENKPFWFKYLSMHARMPADAANAGEFLRQTTVDAKNTKNGRGCISGVWEIQSNRKHPPCGCPMGSVAHCMGGREFSAVFSPSLGDASCCGVLFFPLAASMSLLSIKSRVQTWPCHILGSHKGWCLRNRCLPYVDVLKGGFFHSSSAMRASGRPRSALERLECQQTCFIMAPNTGSKKPVETWRPERDLDCTRNKVGSRERKTWINHLRSC